MTTFLPKRVAASIAAALIASSVPAFAAPVAAQTEAAIRAAVMGEGLGVVQIAASPIPQLFEVFLNDGTLLYATADGKHFVIGDIFDPVNKRAITQERLAELKKLDLDRDVPAGTLKLGDRNGTRRVVVVADPLCGYCQAFHATLKTVPSLKVDVILVAVLGPQSQSAAMGIACAKDPEAAFEDAMLGKLPASTAACPDGEGRLKANYAWMKNHPITATPTTYFANGSSASGQLSREELLEKLDTAGSK